MTPFLSRTAGAFPHAFWGARTFMQPTRRLAFWGRSHCVLPRARTAPEGDQLLVWDAASDVTLVDPFGNRHGLRCIPPFRRDAFHSGIVARGDSIRGETVSSLLLHLVVQREFLTGDEFVLPLLNVGTRRFECLPLLIVLLPTLASRMRVRGGPKVDRV